MSLPMKFRQAPEALFPPGMLLLLLVPLFFLMTGCGDDDDNPVAPADDLRTTFDLQILGAIPYPANNPPLQERIALGKLLFYDPILGGEKDVSCATCHHPDFAFADRRALAIGVSGAGLGPQRIQTDSDRIGMVPRNSPTVLNTAFNGDEQGMPSHDGFMFLDGRMKSLEMQASGPLGSRVEMAGDAWSGEVALDSVVARLMANEEYVDRFRAAFPDEAAEVDAGSRESVIDSSSYSRAMASFERELVTRNSPYDRYVMGDDDALSDLQQDGLELFFTKARCAECHSGPMFSDFRFIVQGTPQEGPGKDVIPGDDTGREEATRDGADRYAFRTLTLRNVELTPPYMHDGVFETLDEVVRFYNDGCLPRHPDVTNAMMDSVLVEPLGLTDDEIFAVVEFMNALTDAGTALDAFLLDVPERVPSGLIPVIGLGDPGSGKMVSLD